MEIAMQFESVLRGLSFRPLSAKEVGNKLEDGALLKLERDSENAYDPNAIKVIEPESGEWIGFVAKEHAAEIAPHMDYGVEFECTVNGFMQVGMPILDINSVEPAGEDTEFDAED
jgi:hypothetical protein